VASRVVSSRRGVERRRRLVIGAGAVLFSLSQSGIGAACLPQSQGTAAARARGSGAGADRARARAGVIQLRRLGPRVNIRIRRGAWEGGGVSACRRRGERPQGSPPRRDHPGPSGRPARASECIQKEGGTPAHWHPPTRAQVLKASPRGPAERPRTREARAGQVVARASRASNGPPRPAVTGKAHCAPPLLPGPSCQLPLWSNLRYGAVTAGLNRGLVRSGDSNLEGRAALEPPISFWELAAAGNVVPMPAARGAA
jgi:hypothetical protein